MRNFKLYISLLLLMAFGLVGCQDDFAIPPIVVPEAKKTENITIAKVKEEFWNNADNYIDTIRTKANGDHYIIKGRVISSDATGNIYKNLVIQDETAALTISVNANSLYTYYRLGQEIVIDLTDMYIGKYANLQQLGFPDFSTQYGWQSTFMPLAFLQEHTELNGLPDVEKITIHTTTIAELPTNPEGMQKWQSQLIRLDNVHFDLGGEATFAESDKTTPRALIDDNGNSIMVRNSNYATFKNDILPKGKGSVVAILSRFNKDWQLLLRSAADCIDFGGNQGSKDNPFSVAKAIEIQGKGQSGWVNGYIVGAVKPEVTNVKSNSDIEWQAPTTLANTIVIGATADTKDIKNAIIVKLEQGTPLRIQANLVDNPGLYKKGILINGVIVNVMSTSGIISSGLATEFEIEKIPVSDDLRADFETLNKETPTGYYINSTSTKGWTINNCAVLTGAEKDANPAFAFIGKITGLDGWAFAPNLNGKVGVVSSIISPLISTGCGKLTFSYGYAFTEANGIDFNVVIKQNGAVVKSVIVKDDKATKLTQYTQTIDANIKGAFTLEFTPNSPSNATDGNKDRVCIYNVSWTENK